MKKIYFFWIIIKRILVKNWSLVYFLLLLKIQLLFLSRISFQQTSKKKTIPLVDFAIFFFQISLPKIKEPFSNNRHQTSNNQQRNNN